MNSCCSNNTKKKCIRKSDKKVFNLPRKFSKRRCLKGPINGFTMRSSCAPFKDCKKLKGGKKKFLYNPNDPEKSFDVYIDKNPNDTISIKYKTLNDVKNTIKKLEKYYKSGKYSHKRIWQVGMIMKVRLESIKKHHKTKKISERYNLSKKYFNFLHKRTKTKKNKRKYLKFKL